MKPIPIMKIFGIIIIIVMVVAFILFFKYVDVGERLAKQNYNNEEDWMWNLGLFIAIMMGFLKMFEDGLEFLFPNEDILANTKEGRDDRRDKRRNNQG